MKFANRINVLLLGLIITLFSHKVIAQESSGNAFSPYSLYGIGMFDSHGTAASQTMASVGIATRNPFNVSTMNPASYSVAARQSMLFSFGMKGSNDYLRSATSKTSHNNFNLNDVSAQFPIAKNIGFGLSYAPFSSVGYKISFTDTSEDVASQIGLVDYNYVGNGGIADLKAGLGWEVAKGLSIGANMIYYFGTINRYSQIAISPIITTDLKYKTYAKGTEEHISMIGGEIGLQYDAKLRYDKHLTFGFVFQPKLNQSMDKTVYETTSDGIIGDSIHMADTKERFSMPAKYSLGIAYRTPKMSLAVDYNYQDWSDAFYIGNTEKAKLTKYQDIKIGFEYTPNATDIRSAMKRWTYRLGLKGASSYMMMNSERLREYAITGGVGVPMQKGTHSLLNVGFEVGQRGTISNGLIKDTYFKIFLGVNIFATNEWFLRHKFK